MLDGLATVTSSSETTLAAMVPETSANDTLPLPVRMVQWTMQRERRLLKESTAYMYRFSGLAAAVHTLSDVLGMQLPPSTPSGGIDRTIQEAPAAGIQGWKSAIVEGLKLGNRRSFGGMFTFLLSRWAFACLAMALILNRIAVYAASRQRILLSWEKRLALRILPILLLFGQITQLLQSIRCQTSPAYSVDEHGHDEAGITGTMDWHSPGIWLHSLSSSLLYGSNDRDACMAVGMRKSSVDSGPLHGSFALLWPTFLCICLSRVIETMSCSLQQQQPMTETGLSVFEHALAFAEVETMLYSALGTGVQGMSHSHQPSTVSEDPPTPTHKVEPTFQASATIMALTDAVTSLSGYHTLDRKNVPVEVLLIALISCCNSLSSNVIAVFGRQRSFRLVNTGIWALCFMSAFIWGFFSVSRLVRMDADGKQGRPVSGLLHFPTVCIMGFAPHLLVVIGMAVCVWIYLLALFLTAMSLGSNPEIPQPTSLTQRLAFAHDNLQAAVQVRDIKIRWHEDFYTALLRIGFIALTAASDAVFLNEGRAVEVRQLTWLEEDRLEELRQTRRDRTKRSATYTTRLHTSEDFGLSVSSNEPSKPWHSGYAQERKLKGADANKPDSMDEDGMANSPTERSDGVGAMQRNKRWHLLYILWRGIVFLMGGWIAHFSGMFLDRIGVTARPSWLRMIIGVSQKRAALEREQKARGARLLEHDILEFWYLSEAGELVTPQGDDVDIEHEMRRRIHMEHPLESAAGLEQRVDEKLYQWWKSYGWWGTRDDSGEYQPTLGDDEDDITSVVSESTAASVSDDREWKSDADGRRTPTRSNPHPVDDLYAPRESNLFDTPLDAPTLQRLLNPPDRAAKEEARMLASHLSASETGKLQAGRRPLTRSLYEREVQGERTRVLLAGRQPSAAIAKSSAALGGRPTSSNRPLTPSEESSILESLIISRRQQAPSASSSSIPVATATSSSGSSNNISHKAAETISSSSEASFQQQQQPPESLASQPPSLCVVCQSSPRTIIAWPCRCLCVCEDCRVNLALNNFGSCVTCRRTVGGFVRLWVP